MEIAITHIDTACILLEINGFKILTDPTLDQAGGLYSHTWGAFSHKTTSPALTMEQLQGVELVLLSHHQHQDNFDVKGKEFAAKVKTVVSTKAAAKTMSNVIGLDEWESCEIDTPKVPKLKITAVPAQHRPSWLPNFISGKTIGFVLEWEGQENGVLYISGDTTFFKGLGDIAQKYKLDIGIFHVGSAQFPYLTGFGEYTMNSKGLIKAAQVMKPTTVIPIHHKGWTHFKELESEMQRILSEATETQNKMVFLTSAEKIVLRE